LASGASDQRATGDPDMVAQPATAERMRYLTDELKIADTPATLRRDSAAFQLMKTLLNELPPPRGK
jgi:hypothetical protein